MDALLQGRVKGMSLVEQLHASGSQVPVIVLTVPQQPVQVNPDARHRWRAADAVHGV